jgi:hypothetical protein
MPDTRFEPMVIYCRRFRLWWGLFLFLCKLGSRRQLDFQLRDVELAVLDNRNRISDGQQESLPVNKTLSHFLGHVGSGPLAGLRTQCVRQLKAAFPQTRLCARGDSLFACGPVLTTCEQNHWSFVLTFKPGRTPSLWRDFQGLLKLSPDNRLNCTLADGTHQVFHWVNHLEYQDDDDRWHKINALLLEETASPEKHLSAWITDLPLRQNTVSAVAAHGGRVRCNIENQGFNIQKNSGLNLEHAYSTEPDVLKAFDYLLQIAHLFLQMFERGSLLQQLAKEYASSPLQLFGSLKNLTQRLRECLRYFKLDDQAFSTAPCQIRLVDSS